MRNEYFAFLLSLAFFVLSSFSGRSQSTLYSIGDLGSWNYSQAITGFGIDAEGEDGAVGQAFSIKNGNALVDSISFPVLWNSSQGSIDFFSVNVAAWNGAQPTGPLLYSGTVEDYNVTPGWQTYTVQPVNLALNQNQQYVLFLTANNFLGSEIFDAQVGYAPAGAYLNGRYFFTGGHELSLNDLFSQSWIPVSLNMAFDIDYQLVPVPEPGTFMLCCLSGALLWIHRRAGFRFHY